MFERHDGRIGLNRLSDASASCQSERCFMLFKSDNPFLEVLNFVSSCFSSDREVCWARCLLKNDNGDCHDDNYEGETKDPRGKMKHSTQLDTHFLLRGRYILTKGYSYYLKHSKSARGSEYTNTSASAF